ncbi:hypothetical protein B0J17DRAFT_717180 [Rhizoctonia solani]|nr:hypothetical protein B0J17DRAFT_717180 [Rhizoctonia solani]
MAVTRASKSSSGSKPPCLAKSRRCCVSTLQSKRRSAAKHQMHTARSPDPTNGSEERPTSGSLGELATSNVPPSAEPHIPHASKLDNNNESDTEDFELQPLMRAANRDIPNLSNDRETGDVIEADPPQAGALHNSTDRSNTNSAAESNEINCNDDGESRGSNSCAVQVLL